MVCLVLLDLSIGCLCFAKDISVHLGIDAIYFLGLHDSLVFDRG